MYKNYRILCVIPARGGSKGLPQKNIKELLGKPLIAHTIEHALGSKYIDRVIVSTEDDEIARIAKKFGAEIPFKRPEELAQDESSGIDVLLNAMDWMDKENYAFDILVLLHVTAPLRTIGDINNCIELLVESHADNVFSVTEAYRNPYFNMVEIKANKKVSLVKEGKFVTRQSTPIVYDMNASIYVWWKNILKEKMSVFLEDTNIYIMPKERSVDIDDILDFKIVEMLMKEKLLLKVE